MIWRSGLVAAVLVGVGCGGDVDVDADADATRYMCRGVLGLRCPPGLVCVDLDDGCYPERGHMDCIGECIEP